MKHSEITAGEVYEVGSETYAHLAKVIEVGTFSKRVYRGSRDYRGSLTTVKGARVAYLDTKTGEPRMVKSDTRRKTVKRPGPFGGFTESEEIVTTEVDATEWVASREVLRTAAEYRKAQQAIQERKAAQAKYADMQKDAAPKVRELLKAAGVSAYVSEYSTEIKLSYTQLLAVVEAAKEA